MIRALHKTGSWLPLLHATCKQIVTSEAVGVLSAYKESLGASDGSSASLSSGVSKSVSKSPSQSFSFVQLVFWLNLIYIQQFGLPIFYLPSFWTNVLLLFDCCRFYGLILP